MTWMRRMKERDVFNRIKRMNVHKCYKTPSFSPIFLARNEALMGVWESGPRFQIVHIVHIYSR